uniref:Uncharacterized protein n=1 Tax=Steinernema glaseri TaxID=37863 RepID=A0A1I7YZ13_9BILA
MAFDASSFGPLNATSPVDVCSPQSNGLTTTCHIDFAPATHLEDYGTLTMYHQPQAVGRSSAPVSAMPFQGHPVFSYWNSEHYVNTNAFDDIRQQAVYQPQYAHY